MRNLTISINIEYKRNRTWGWNPTATVTAPLYAARSERTRYFKLCSCGTVGSPTQKSTGPKWCGIMNGRSMVWV